MKNTNIQIVKDGGVSFTITLQYKFKIDLRTLT